MCILELSKLPMHEFHFKYIEMKYGSKSRLLFTDTVGLMYEIETANVYEDFSKNKKMFYYSNNSAKSKYYDDSNALVVGNMKDEMRCGAIKEFFGLKTKNVLDYSEQF